MNEPGPAAPTAWSADPRRTQELVERLNHGWRLAGPDDGARSFRQRLLLPVRRVLARLFGPQETFNSTLVQYINSTCTPLDAAFEELIATISLDEVRRMREALAARERRFETAMHALRTEQDELRTAIGVMRQQSRTSLASGSGGGVSNHSDGAAAASATAGPATANGPAGTGQSSDAYALSASYVGFEDQFRGSPDAIRERLESYLPLFTGAHDVLDIGCGRGEFLRLLGERGIRARGIDMNPAMVDVCRREGLDATTADALGYLRAQPDDALGGLFAAQVVEHLEPGYLTHLLDEAFAKLRPGGTIVLETINPACWFAFFESYVRDITHVRPLHPDTLRFLLLASGFQHVEIHYRVPYPEHEKLQPVPAIAALADSAETLNANVEKLNRLLFTHLDYAAIARKP